MEILVVVAVLAVALIVFLARALKGAARSRESSPQRGFPERDAGPAAPGPPTAPAREAPSPPVERVPPTEPTARREQPSFAVIDVETTGFNPVPGGTNRIVEVAVVRLSSDGRVEDEYVTLVNPQGRMGATRIHGITNADVAGAPTFPEIAGDIAARISGAIVVAHNVSFDMEFLAGEYEHMGIVMPEVPRLCTLDLAYRFADVSCRKLGFLCEEYGIPIEEHTALGDARAVSQLLLRFLADAKGMEAPVPLPDGPVVGVDWCGKRPSGISVRRGESGERRQSALLAKRSVRRPVEVTEERYFEAVELAISDGTMTPEESAALCALALQLGLSMRDLNMRFVQSLADGAKADGSVTSSEADEIHKAARLLDVAEGDVAAMLSAAEAAPTRVLTQGTPVCLLGSFDLSTMAQVIAAVTERGLTIRKNITGTVKLVVVEAAGSELKRQSRAKALGIPVVTATEFIGIASSVAVEA